MPGPMDAPTQHTPDTHSHAMKFPTARRHALSLPGATESPHHQYNSWRVQGRIFATIPPGESHLHVFVSELEREQALALYPEFVEKLIWGGKVAGIRIALAPAAAPVVKRLLHSAWAAKGGRDA